MKDSVWLKVAVPVELKKDFKIACWLESVSQTDKMLEMIHQSVTNKRKLIEEAKKVRNL